MTRTVALWRKFWMGSLAAIGLILCLGWLASCNSSNTSQSDEQLKEQAANATQQVKQGAQQAAADAKVAAANAERKVDDVAAGVKEGLRSDTKPSPGTKSSGMIDINSASTADLESLPGISAVRARRIIDKRPYSSARDLVSKGVVSESEYSRISGKIIAD